MVADLCHCGQAGISSLDVICGCHLCIVPYVSYPLLPRLLLMARSHGALPRGQLPLSLSLDRTVTGLKKVDWAHVLCLEMRLILVPTVRRIICSTGLGKKVGPRVNTAGKARQK